jgi:hypothetical protein
MVAIWPLPALVITIYYERWGDKVHSGQTRNTGRSDTFGLKFVYDNEKSM